ncbi:PTS system mannose-specific IIB component [Ruminiclostridium sufflavum DSM 19573]|uniref:PTS system mannose-specific IIB component n=1 Tax=Ruminiclostridium sufflavum DSM 19573 TaxID=1121337 RepID=A0A318XQ38_9FIRM|nr:PTS sugar transporter subunit IIB [Ruminiclostridium sufflavum]PYG87929.1 PTS system mannose-specific IIB component [Ruminiclostridium sufflavum DSM 19573]
MDITIFRIDDRLIHGQVITAWIAYADAETIIVADDNAAGDEFQQSLLKMATPNSVKLNILSIQDTIELLKTDTSSTRALLLVRTPKGAYDILDAGIKIESINIGNINMKKNKIKILGNFWVSQEDIDCLYKISEKGVKLEVRAVPNERSQDAVNLLKKIK